VLRGSGSRVNSFVSRSPAAARKPGSTASSQSASKPAADGIKIADHMRSHGGPDSADPSTSSGGFSIKLAQAPALPFRAQRHAGSRKAGVGPLRDLGSAFGDKIGPEVS
jgi:hypothetical protein